MRGKTYTGFRRPKQQKRTFQDVERNERILGPTCSSEVCKKSSKRRCHEITEASRREIFKAFWNDLDWEQRKVYVSNLVSKREKMRAKKKLRNKKIEIPNDYHRLTEASRQKPFPYEVISPNFDFFRNYNCSFVYNSIRPGKRTVDPTVTEIRALRYEQGIISYKLDFDQDFVPLPHRPKKNPDLIDTFPQLFQNKLSISKKKFDHLQDIKSKIDKNYWSFYDNLSIK
nr:unnamed protein product [Callosobruchus chinensis]